MKRQDWPLQEWRSPRRTRFDYLALSHLSHVLQRNIAQHLTGRRDLTLIDVGAGEKPYYPFLRPYIHRHLGLDYRRKSNTDVQGTAEQLPFPDQCADVILCTQVLEHVADPSVTVREWHRVLRPGGLAFVSTHGTFVYHPDPADYWRWTHAGLRKLFEDAGLLVRSTNTCGGTLAAVASVLAVNASLAANRVGLSYVMRLALLVLHLAVDAVEPPRRSHIPRDIDYGEIAINYLIVAERV